MMMNNFAVIITCNSQYPCSEFEFLKPMAVVWTQNCSEKSTDV